MPAARFLQAEGRTGGLSSKACTVSIDNAEFTGTASGPAIYAMNCDLVAKGLTVTRSGDATYAAVYLYYNGNPMNRVFMVNLGSCKFNDNVGGGLKVESRLNWADVGVVIDGCEVMNNGYVGIVLRLGADYPSFDNTNGTIDVSMTDTQITGNRNLGLWFNVYRWRLDGTAAACLPPLPSGHKI